MQLPVNPPVLPMLAKNADALPEGEGWIFEPKWDGFRTLIFRDGDELFIQSRDEKPLDRYFPELVEALKAQLPQRCVLDGEIVIARNGALDFEALQLRLQWLDELREVAVERLLVAALDEQLVAVAENERAEAVPFWLEDPGIAFGEGGEAFGEHRQDGRVDGELHVNGVQVWPQECGCESVCSLLSERIGTDSVECRMYEQ